jgi:hypothetical protein
VGVVGGGRRARGRLHCQAAGRPQPPPPAAPPPADVMPRERWGGGDADAIPENTPRPRVPNYQTPTCERACMFTCSPCTLAAGPPESRVGRCAPWGSARCDPPKGLCFIGPCTLLPGPRGTRIGLGRGFRFFETVGAAPAATRQRAPARRRSSSRSCRGRCCTWRRSTKS